MKAQRIYNLALITLIGLSVFLLAFSVEARERGDREHPNQRPDRPTQPAPTPPPPPPTPDPEPEPDPVIVPQELLERWRIMLELGFVEQVEIEYRAFVEFGIYPSDEEEEEEPPVVTPPECTEEVLTDPREQRVRDRNINRTRGDDTTTTPVCEQEEEDPEPPVEEEEEEEEEPPFEASYEDKVMAELHRLVNVARLDEGLGILVHDGMLAYLATTHSEWMLSTGIFSHDRVNEDSSLCDFGCRLAEVNYPVTSWGENIAWRVGSHPEPEDLAALLFDGWMGSPSHRDNILSDTFTIMGIGTAMDGGLMFITQDFAAN